MEDIIQLKRVVMESFEAKGILSEIRAQIRASVFKAVEESDQSPKHMNFEWEKENPLCIPQKDSRSIMTILIVDLCHHLDLQYSANVLKHETNIHLSKCNLEKLREIGVDTDKVDEPYMYQVLRQMKEGEGQPGTGQGLRESRYSERESQAPIENRENQENQNHRVSHHAESEKISNSNTFAPQSHGYSIGTNPNKSEHMPLQNQNENVQESTDPIHQNQTSHYEPQHPSPQVQESIESPNNNQVFVDHLRNSEKRNHQMEQFKDQEINHFEEDQRRPSEDEEEYEDPNDLYLREPEVLDMTADSKLLKEFEFDEMFELDS